jgi:hypothetical protein
MSMGASLAVRQKLSYDHAPAKRRQLTREATAEVTNLDSSLGAGLLPLGFAVLRSAVDRIRINALSPEACE